MNDNPTPPTNELPVDVEGTLAMEPTKPQLFRYTLVMAEVIFECELGMQSRRLQFISKSDGDVFPRSRLLQLQQLAATGVINELKAISNGAVKNVKVEAVYILGTVDCGWMTEEEFLHNPTTLVAPAETPAADNELPPTADNVVPLRPA